jgi:hypothetical protein
VLSAPCSFNLCFPVCSLLCCHYAYYYYYYYAYYYYYVYYYYVYYYYFVQDFYFLGLQRFASSAAILFMLNNAVVSFAFAIWVFLVSAVFFVSWRLFICFRFCYYLCVVVNVCDNTVANTRCYFPINAGAEAKCPLYIRAWNFVYVFLIRLL